MRKPARALLHVALEVINDIEQPAGTDAREHKDALRLRLDDLHLTVELDVAEHPRTREAHVLVAHRQLAAFRRFVLGPRAVAYSVLCDHGAFALGFNWLLAWDPSFVVEELPVADRLGLDEDETLYMYRITRPTPGLSADELLGLAAAAHA